MFTNDLKPGKKKPESIVSRKEGRQWLSDISLVSDLRKLADWSSADMR